jgi:DNA-binding transcriptional regulator YiaG
MNQNLLAKGHDNLLAAIIRDWQRKRKLTNPAAAKELGVPLRTYGDWKGGQHAPRGFALKQLREKLKASARRPNEKS